MGGRLEEGRGSMDSATTNGVRSAFVAAMEDVLAL